MYEQPISPINHSTASGVATTAVEAAKGGLKWGLFAGPVVGAAIAGTVSLFLSVPAIFGAASVAAGLSAAAAATGSLALWGLGGAVLGGAAMFVPFVAPLVMGIGALLGVVRGADKGLDRVSQERGAAIQLSAQVEAYKAQTAAMAPTTNIYAPSTTNPSPFPAQGSQYNMAATGVQAGNDNREYAGRIAGAELAAAKA